MGGRHKKEKDRKASRVFALLWVVLLCGATFFLPFRATPAESENLPSPGLTVDLRTDREEYLLGVDSVTVSGMVYDGAQAVPGATVTLELADSRGPRAVTQLTAGGEGSFEWRVNKDTFVFAGPHRVYAKIGGRADFGLATFQMKVAPPSADPPAGTYPNPQQVTMRSETREAQIYYKKYATEAEAAADQSSLAAGENLYTGPFLVEKSAVVRAVAAKDGLLSEERLFAYVIASAPPVESGSFAGAVTGGPDGRALRGVKVELRQNNELRYAATTDANGGFTIAEVAPGVYRVIVFAPGFLKVVDSIEIVSGKKSQKNFQLAASTPGDLDGSGLVDDGDLILLLSKYRLTESDAGWDPAFDLYPDGKINLFDLVIAGKNFGNVMTVTQK